MQRHKRLVEIVLGGLAGILLLLAGCASRLPASTPENKGNPRKMTQSATPPPGRQFATLAGGCFWCTEAIFEELKGVDRVEPGYIGGKTVNPTYEQVCSGNTGHAEAVQVTFDPKVVSYHDLLAIFFATHNPTTRNRQGADVGTQYRSAIFYHGPEQQATAAQVMREIEKERIWPAPLVTEVAPATVFYPAEEYHRDYYARNPAQGYCQIIIAPKVAKFREQYAAKLKR